jgi:hypothetical protein
MHCIPELLFGLEQTNKSCNHYVDCRDDKLVERLKVDLSQRNVRYRECENHKK